MDYVKLFYWLVVADNARLLFQWGAGIFTAFAIISTIINIFSRAKQSNEIANGARSWRKWSIPFAFLFWSMLIFTPSKRDSLLIVAGGGTLNYLTTDSTAKQLPKELSGFILTELKSMAKSSAVDLGVKTTKEKVIEKAKGMSAEEIIKEMKSDSTFANMLLK